MSEFRAPDSDTGGTPADAAEESPAFEDRAGRLAGEHRLQTLRLSGSPHVRSWWRLRRLYAHDQGRLRERLKALRARLEKAYEQLPTEQRNLTGAQRWLYDNDYLAWRALRMADRDLPARFHRNLPLLAGGGTRIEALANTYLAEDSARARLPALTRFLSRYQEVLALDLAELWALPTFLRVSALETIVDAGDDEAAVADAMLMLHAIEQLDWRDVVESQSTVERLLQRDPADIYRHMDDATRDHYRRAVEVLARRSGKSQVEVCESTLEAAHRAGPEDRHVGNHLLGPALRDLERSLGVGGSLGARAARFAKRQAGALYLLLIVVMALAVATPVYLYARALGSGWLAILLVFLLAVPVWLAAEALVHRLVVVFSAPRFLPKLDLTAGVPASAKTIVAMPCLLSSPAEIDELFAQLERHVAGNFDRNLAFTLLADLPDAPVERLPTDAALIGLAEQSLAQIRRRHPHASFHLLTRPRRYNPSEGYWLGWERKRGKLMQFNELLLSHTTTAFDLHDSPASDFEGFTYVITLDADTALPPTAAAELIGTSAHPLNRPRFSGAGRLIAGYTVLQPRIEFLPVSVERSRFSRWFAGSDGLDLYTRAVSDPYMDLFGEGLYAGKGIYDVAGFSRTLRDKVPENTILSHDLFEGGSGRAALVSDLVLYEPIPESYLAHARRSRRWIRGDWQLWPFLFGPGLSWVARWAARQNLVRSLAPVFYLLTLVCGWTVLPGRPAAWTLLVLLASATPFLIGVFDALRGTGEAGRRRIWDLGGVALHASRWLFELVVLPHAAWQAASAIWLTLRRLFVERRGLLNWRTAADVERDVAHGSTLRSWWREMAAAPIAAVMVGTLVLLVDRPGSLIALPFLAAWAVAPYVAWLASRPLVSVDRSVDAAQATRIRKIARRTFLFFERFVGPQDNWLPPDHFQEYPNGAIAHRTSPTNVGLLFTTGLGAYDLGFHGARTLLARSSSTMATVERLERYRGHLFNWYDTKTLRPLAPRYVSTVDSGNLLASLLVLKEGCAELPDEPVVKREQRDGLLTVIELYRESAARLPDFSARATDAFAKLQALTSSAPSGPAGWWRLLQELQQVAIPLVDDSVLEMVRASSPRVAHQQLAELGIWAGRLHAHVQELLRDLEGFMPWLTEDNRALAGAHLAASGLTPETTAVLDEMPSFRELQEILRRHADQLRSLVEDPKGGTTKNDETATYLATVDAASALISELLDGAAGLAQRAGRQFDEAEFGFLFDQARSVFRIGFDVDNGHLDNNAYDLLASEARIASLLAIATRQAPPEHWLHLARPISLLAGRRTVLSWSGTMFEYLMPALFMETPEDGLQSIAISAAIEQQVEFGARHGVPWGVSESAFAETDAHDNYQYRAFGVPELALDRLTGDDLVIAPYATLMALQLTPERALANLEHLEAAGAAGLYGFYDALDYSPSRRTRSGGPTIVRTYMAHHHGMSFMAMTNLLKADGFVRRFHADARVQSATYLLHEGAPTNAPLLQLERRRHALNHGGAQEVAAFRPRQVPAATTATQVTTLSNGRLTTLLTNSGGGYSRWGGVDLTRWRPDPTQESSGQWLYLADLTSAELWSATKLPVSGGAEKDTVTFLPHMVVYGREVGGIGSRLEVSLAPEDDVEIRRLSLHNLTDRARTMAVTSYSEVVLADHASDARHQAFSNLFVESSFEAELGALIFRRRRREPEEKPGYLLQMVIARDPLVLQVEYETDRGEFIGRGRDVSRPRGALAAGLGGNLGATLDPVSCLRATLNLPAGGQLELAFVTIVAASRPQVIELARRYRHWDSLIVAASAAEAGERAALLKLALDPEELPFHDRLLSRVLFPTSGSRAAKELRGRNHGTQADLWAFGISGDNPIVLLKVVDVARLDPARRVLAAHRRWRESGRLVDIVIVDRSEGGYRQGTQDAVRSIIEEQAAAGWLGRDGGIFLLSGSRLDDQALTMLEAVAVVVIGVDDDLTQALQDPSGTDTLPALVASAPQLADTYLGEPLKRPTDLLLDNGYGGFSQNGKEYVIFSDAADPAAAPTPAPWVNVLANEQFGSLVGESGASTTWAVNSSENRLSPWSNDPVTDPSGEVLYLRDEETANIWTPTPQPAPGPGGYLTRHGAGKTTFQHVSHGLEQELTTFVPPDAPVKIVRLRLHNLQQRQRRLTATYYLQWVLGTTPEANRDHVVTWYDTEHSAVMARNSFRADFAPQVAFVGGSLPTHGFTTDRGRFLGRDGSLARPSALRSIGLGSDGGPSEDPCAALQLHLDLKPGESQTLHFVVGRGQDHDQALALLAEYRAAARAERSLMDTEAFWEDLLGTVEVKTPEPAFDLMLNRWLLYQTVAARLWGRAGFYQASGAFGFRDQLQDVLALLHARPQWTREQLLKAAAHQFEEGDVLHWWHPPRGQGVRTRFSDDLVWLPFVTAAYVGATADAAVLDEEVPYLSAPELAPGVDESYDLFRPGALSGSLFDHCVRALERASTKGAHGLPLMGSGDWNDGMSRVGAGGKGESVWLAFFLATTLREFATLCEERSEDELARRFRERAASYQAATEAQAWDGDWYLRAYYDDGTPLGSHASEEARIDIIAQAWSVLSGGADEARRATAMASAEEQLVRDDEALILLLTPPFDDGPKDPGYIKGYPPGVRENGGQYTHGAIWFVWAMATMGRADRAMELFSLLNPAARPAEPAAARHYRVEPYVVAADVYGWPPHVGRGGWTWYTGSAAWLYRLGVERLLGLKRAAGGLTIDPVIPASWPGFSAIYRHGSSRYRIEVSRAGEGTPGVGLELDGEPQTGKTIALVDDGATHQVRVVLAAG